MLASSGASAIRRLVPWRASSFRNRTSTARSGISSARKWRSTRGTACPSIVRSAASTGRGERSTQHWPASGRRDPSRPGSRSDPGEATMSQTFDAIVIGSGFGGAITACRLSEKGMRVLVLERGRRWAPKDYPRKPGDAWLFNDRDPARAHGWMDLRFFRHMTVSQAAGVGGGSLVYSMVALEAHPSLFDRGWPAEITFAELKPYYETVARVM